MNIIFWSIYIICGLINAYILVLNNLKEEGSILPTEVVTAFLFWWAILFVQICVNISAMIFIKSIGEDEDE